jgi:hypothetical protein
MRKETRDPVWSLLTRFLRKLVPRSSVTCARNMGAYIPCTTHKIVIGKKRMEMRNLTSERPIPRSSLLHNYAKRWTSSSKQSKNKIQKRRNIAIVILILTQNRELGRVA